MIMILSNDSVDMFALSRTKNHSDKKPQLPDSSIIDPIFWGLGLYLLKNPLRSNIAKSGQQSYYHQEMPNQNEDRVQAERVLLFVIDP